MEGRVTRRQTRGSVKEAEQARLREIQDVGHDTDDHIMHDDNSNSNSDKVKGDSGQMDVNEQTGRDSLGVAGPDTHQRKYSLSESLGDDNKGL